MDEGRRNRTHNQRNPLNGEIASIVTDNEGSSRPRRRMECAVFRKRPPRGRDCVSKVSGMNGDVGCGKNEKPQCETNKKKSIEELDEVAVAAEVNGRIKSADMPPLMQIHALRFARQLCDINRQKFSSMEIVSSLKKDWTFGPVVMQKFDRAYGPVWHCIVGGNFGSFVTHSVGGFMSFSIDKLTILLFKTSIDL
eukprot:Gb_28248 [translate_table: standard]